MNRSSRSKKLTIIIYLFIIIFCANSSWARAIFDDDIEILQSDANGVTLRYIVPDASIIPYSEDGFNLLSVPGTAQNAKEGTVEIPVKIVPLAMPPDAVARITVQASEYAPMPFRQLAPYFSRSSDDALHQAYLQSRLTKPAIPGEYPYITSSNVTRGLNIARLAIPTARYLPETQELSVLKNITVRVDFMGGNLKFAEGYRDPGPAYRLMLEQVVANYDVGRNWYLPRHLPFAKAAMTNSTPFDSSSTWIRIELTTDGVYCFGWPQFSMVGINPLNIDPSHIRIFYGGGQELPILNSLPRPQLTEIPIKILGGDDGSFDNGDLVIFYADAVDSWQYSTQFHRFQRYKDHYTDKNVYWLTFDGDFQGQPRRMASVDGAPDGSVDVSIESYTAVSHKEQETVFWFSGDEEVDEFEWYWGRGLVFSVTSQLYDLVPGSEAKVTVRHQYGDPTLSVNGGASIDGEPYQTYSTYNTSDLVDGANSLQIHSPSDMTLDYVDVDYKRWLKVIDGVMTFAQPDTFGTIRYTLTRATTPYFLFDIGDRNNPVEIVNGTLNNGVLVFDDTVSALSHKRYCFTSRDRLKSPGAVSLYQMDNLRDPNLSQNRADEIIITYDSFFDQAVRLAQHRQSVSGLATRVVKISDIYNQFSYGLTDVVAIRDFLKYAYENWSEPAPSFACLLGDGNYDYRNYRGNNLRNYIPPFENTTAMGDECFIYFGPEGYLDSDANLLPDMVIGRINARSAQEADDIIGKIEDYDSHPDLGPWRNRVVIVADDNLHPGDPRETYHTNPQAEALANGHVPNKFEINKIYMVDYLMGPGGEKPDARNALISAWNQGALIINWIGHGSANLWADEHIFRRIEDIPRLNNGKKLPLVFTASCSIGRFDVPNVECMAEELLRGRSRGSISVISATRDSWATPNQYLNNYFFDQVLGHDSIGIGMALYMAKYLRANRGQIDGNDRLYMVFGDPAQLLQFPKYDIRITAAPDTLVALSVDSLAGEITDNYGNLQTDFNGTVWITVKDGSIVRQVTLRDWLNNPISGQVSFISPGSTIFLGPADVVNGHFSSRFFIPKDISYGSHGAKIYTYAGNGSYDAVGVEDSLVVSGSLSVVQDSIGPTVSLFVDDRLFGEGLTMVPIGFTLGAEIHDEHGINITGQLGHGIVATIDGGEIYSGDVTSYFRYNQGDYQSGRLDIKLPEIPTGEHEISLKVWDNFNNSTLITRRIEAVATDRLELTDVMNYPNPISKGMASTVFQYCLNDNVDRVTIKLFTESGKKIKTIDINSGELTRMDCNQVSWDLLDADGDRLANGIYLYKVTAEKRQADGSSENADKTGKLVILR
jgi:hypothetical protein